MAKVRRTTKGNASMNMNMEKDGIIVLQARKHLYFFVSTAEANRKFGLIIMIIS